MQNNDSIKSMVSLAATLDKSGHSAEADMLSGVIGAVELALTHPVTAKYAQSGQMALEMLLGYIESLPLDIRYALSSSEIDELRIRTASNRSSQSRTQQFFNGARNIAPKLKEMGSNLGGHISDSASAVANTFFDHLNRNKPLNLNNAPSILSEDEIKANLGKPIGEVLNSYYPKGPGIGAQLQNGVSNVGTQFQNGVTGTAEAIRNNPKAVNVGLGGLAAAGIGAGILHNNTSAGAPGGAVPASSAGGAVPVATSPVGGAPASPTGSNIGGAATTSAPAASGGHGPQTLDMRYLGYGYSLMERGQTYQQAQQELDHKLRASGQSDAYRAKINQQFVAMFQGQAAVQKQLHPNGAPQTTTAPATTTTPATSPAVDANRGGGVIPTDMGATP